MGHITDLYGPYNFPKDFLWENVFRLLLWGIAISWSPNDNVYMEGITYIQQKRERYELLSFLYSVTGKGHKGILISISYD